MTDRLMRLVDVDNFETLFNQLGWSKPDAPREFETHGVHLDKVATYRGLNVWVCYQLPPRKEQRLIDAELAKISAERLVVFTDGASQDWRWPRHAKLGSVNAKLMAHRHERGVPDPDLRDRLEAMKIGIDDAPPLPVLLDRMRLVFDRESETASSRAARLMGRLYEDLAKAGMNTGESTQLLGRLLFLWFGDDTDMWRADAFHNWLVEHTTPEDLSTKLGQLFQAVNDPSMDSHHGVPPELREFQGLRYINGGLFAQKLTVPTLPPKFRDELLEASNFDWSIISPAIFGSMFQTVEDKKSRREMGEHYTTEENILKTLRPLFLNELEEKLEQSWDNKAELTKLHKRLAGIRFLDPACGCGNFIIVAYRELRALELRLILRRRELDRQDGKAEAVNYQTEIRGDGLQRETDTAVRMSNFAGIEIMDWPAAIASTAMLLVDHLANQHMAIELGTPMVRLPIDDHNRANIYKGNALQVDWLSLLEPGTETYFCGNPPFIGMNRMDATQQSDRALVFSSVPSEGLRTGRLDYVTCWYAKAASYLEKGLPGSAAFVSTNSITQGEQARTMDPLLQLMGCEINFAHQTFQWTSEAPGKAAAVHCVIIGFSAKPTKPKQKTLFEYRTITSAPVATYPKHITFHLRPGDSFTPPRRRTPLVPEMPMATQGSKPADGERDRAREGKVNGSPGDGLGLLVNERTKSQVETDEIAAKYLRPFMQGEDLLHSKERWCLWLGSSSADERSESRELTERLDRVAGWRSAPDRTKSFRDYADRPHLFTQDRQPDERYFAIPEVSSENREWIPGRFLEPNVIAGNKLIIFPEAELWHAAYLQSSMFMTWVRRFTGRLESRYSVSPALAYFPIPFPVPDEALRGQLEDAIQLVFNTRRAHDPATLADLYDPETMPRDLRDAHAALDQVVDRAFGVPTGITSDSEREAILRKRYDALTA